MHDVHMRRVTAQDRINFRAPSGVAKTELERIAEAHGETISEFIRTAIAERVRRLRIELWEPR